MQSGKVPSLAFGIATPLNPERVPVTSGAFEFISWQSEGKTTIEAPHTEGKDLNVGEVYIHRAPHPSLPDTKLVQAWLYLDDGWKNITNYWNDFRGMAPIAHPTCTNPERFLIFRGDGGPSWVQKAQSDKIRKTTYKATKEKKDARKKGIAARSEDKRGQVRMEDAEGEQSEDNM